jgi:hypothetical protein
VPVKLEMEQEEVFSTIYQNLRNPGKKKTSDHYYNSTPPNTQNYAKHYLYAYSAKL